MTTYVALLRGIGPTDPNMHPRKLAEMFEKLGFKAVTSVISSGNVVFDSPSRDTAALEAKIERALPKHLGFTSTAIVRSRAELESMLKKEPFKGKIHGTEHYLLVSFFKDRRRAPGGAAYTAIDLSRELPVRVMPRLERSFGKAVTSRTWKTVGRIVKKMEAMHG